MQYERKIDPRLCISTLVWMPSLKFKSWTNSTLGHPKPTQFKDPENFEKSEKVLECNCGRIFNSVEELDEHDCLQSTRIITCDKCEKIFRSETAYNYHQSTSHPNENSKDNLEILKGSLISESFSTWLHRSSSKICAKSLSWTSSL